MIASPTNSAVCSECGAVNSQGANFCSKCGQRLVAPASQPAETIAVNTELAAPEIARTRSHPAAAAQAAPALQTPPWWPGLSFASFLGPICLVLLYMPVFQPMGGFPTPQIFEDWRGTAAVGLGLLMGLCVKSSEITWWIVCAAIAVLASLAALVAQMNHGSGAEQTIAVVAVLGSVVGVVSLIASAQKGIKF